MGLWGPYRVSVDDGSGWASNGMEFRTVEEAENYARDLYCRWTAVRRWSVIDRDGVVKKQGGGVNEVTWRQGR